MTRIAAVIGFIDALSTRVGRAAAWLIVVLTVIIVTIIIMKRR